MQLSFSFVISNSKHNKQSYSVLKQLKDLYDTAFNQPREYFPTLAELLEWLMK